MIRSTRFPRCTMTRLTPALWLCLTATCIPALAAPQSAEAVIDRRFAETVRPFLATWCDGCHSGTKPAASFDINQLSDLRHLPVRDDPRWTTIVQRLEAREMPPKAAKQPGEPVRQQVLRWIGEMRKIEISKNAGDPGPVHARRLSNAEYNYTIRDLTGVDMRPAREFPVDPANQEGFVNSGESLRMSSGLMAKYLQAAREVADRMVLKPNGFDFASHAMLVETDRDKYATQRIVDFYDRQPTDLAAYFEAGWRYKHRAALGRPVATLNSVAAETKVSPRYLRLIWQTVEPAKPDPATEEVGPFATLLTMWRALPAPKAKQFNLVREDCIRMRDFVTKIRKRTAKLYTSPVAPGLNANAQPLVSLRNRKIAAQHREFDPAALRVEGEPPAPELVVTKGPPFGRQEVEDLKVAVAAYLKERGEDPDLAVPAGQRARYEAAFARFASVFPDKFCLRERGRFYPVDTPDDGGRYLSAGLHSVMGFFRDDQPLMELILDEKGKKELDTLWEEFEFIADYSARTYIQSVYNGGGRGGPQARSADAPRKEATTEAGIFRTRDDIIARALAGNSGGPGPGRGGPEAPPSPADMQVIVQAVKDHYGNINTAVRWAERARKEAEPRHLDALVRFAARAYRRPLAKDESDEILAYYHELREKSGLTHEEAMRASVVSILVSPDFCYRIDLDDAGHSSVAAKTR
ncbi:MAG: hypothetical protein JWN34_1086 [Bryobacterales bacterium]|nr:hypothetical protein [Bryobacterales bacterium]